MFDISLAGLIGAIAGTAIAGVTYHLFVGVLEQAVRQRASTQHDAAQMEVTLSAVRRIVLIADLLVFAGAGYLIGTSLWG